MARYDLVHVDGSEFFTGMMAMVAEGNGLSYKPINSLQQLTDCLENDNARSYLVGEKIPRRDSGNLEPLCDEVIERIKAKVGNKNPIIVYAATDAARYTASEHGLEFIEQEPGDTETVIDKIKEMLEK